MATKRTGTLDLWVQKRPRKANTSSGDKVSEDLSANSRGSENSHPCCIEPSVDAEAGRLTCNAENTRDLTQNAAALGSSTTRPAGASMCVQSKTNVVHNIESENTRPSTTSAGPMDSSTVHQNKPFCVDQAKPVDPVEIIKLIETQFPETYNIHQHDICRGKGCTNLSNEDTMRISHQNKRREYFSHTWLFDPDLAYCKKTGIQWLVYKENEGMFCLLCRKHCTMNVKNKSEEYNSKPAIRFRKRAITDHKNSSKHKDAVEAELTSRVSLFEKIHQEIATSHHSSIYNAFLAAYWLAKEELPNVKFYSLISLLQSIDNHMKHFKYSSRGTAREIMLILGEVLREDVAARVNDHANCYGILTDEVTDIATIEVNVTFIQYVENSEVKTDFLFVDNLLEESHSANADTIVKVLIKNLKQLHLCPQKMSSFVSDGASVMIGKRNGVAAKLRREVNSSLISLHCVCHRLALACTDTNADIKYINKVHDWLGSLWRFFDDSPKRLAIYLDIQMQLREICLPVTGTESSVENPRVAVERRLKKACSTRWLSFDNSIRSLYQDYLAVLLTLNHLAENEPKARGLLAEFRSAKFMGVVYILREILPVLSILSKILQSGSIHYSELQPAIDKTVTKLQSLSESGEPIDTLKKDLDPMTGRLKLLSKVVDDQADLESHDDGLKSQLRMASGNGIALSNKVEGELRVILDKYVSSLTNNIESRFTEGLPVLNAFAIFDPCLMPQKGTIEFTNYGEDKIKIIGQHFFKTDAQECEQLFDEWRLFKYQIVRWKADLSDVIEKPTVWCLKRLLSLKSCLQYTHLCYIAEVALATPISNAWPERGASAIKRIKTRLRSSLKMNMLDCLLQISVNGPKLNTPEVNTVINNAVKKFNDKKRRLQGKFVAAKEFTKPSTEPSNVVPEPATEIHVASEATTEEIVSADVVSEVTVSSESHNIEVLSADTAIQALGLDEYSSDSDYGSDYDLD
ncbi:zinc finger protein 862-like [Ptychodera flava]|uniref:zinc finger protein 862-like n=1 Tax=Ptychodera flava TaxID=63121 RepID=UPI00396A90CD